LWSFFKKKFDYFESKTLKKKTFHHEYLTT